MHTVILTGLTGDICVLFTANDAYMRDFQLVVPADCVASQDPDENRHALTHMQRVLKADIRPSPALDLNSPRHEPPLHRCALEADLMGGVHPLACLTVVPSCMTAFVRYAT